MPNRASDIEDIKLFQRVQGTILKLIDLLSSNQFFQRNKEE